MGSLVSVANAAFDAANDGVKIVVGGGVVTSTLLASAARTATNQTADQTNVKYKGVVVSIDVTATADTPSIVVTVQGKSSVGGAYFTILASAAITTVSTNVISVYAGMTEAANTRSGHPLPAVWRVDITHSDADSITYSIAADLIP